MLLNWSVVSEYTTGSVH